MAMAFTSLALLTMIGIFSGGMKQVGQSQQVTQSTEAARQMLESAKAMGYDALPTGSVFDARNGDAPVSGFPPPPYPAASGCKLKVQVEQVESNLRSISVQAFYAQDRGVILETYLVKPTP